VSRPIDYRVVPGSFPNPVVSVGVCYTAVDAAAGGLTTGWWAVVLECFSSHPLRPFIPFCFSASDVFGLHRHRRRNLRVRRECSNYNHIYANIQARVNKKI